MLKFENTEEKRLWWEVLMERLRRDRELKIEQAIKDTDEAVLAYQERGKERL